MGIQASLVFICGLIVATPVGAATQEHSDCLEIISRSYEALSTFQADEKPRQQSTLFAVNKGAWDKKRYFDPDRRTEEVVAAIEAYINTISELCEAVR